MAGMIQRINRNLPLAISLSISALAMTGCEYIPESTFELASESRLPEWITLPPGLTRSDVSITMSSYDSLWGNDTKFVLQDLKGNVLEKQYGKVICEGSLQLRNPAQGSPSGYPFYEAISVKGMTETIEHRKMEPLFYVTDDGSVLKQYSAIGCR